VVVPCGKAKIWDKIPQAGPTSARDAYSGTPFKINRQYAERFGDRWVVLSAKYGFLNPDDSVEGPYDVTFKRRSPVPIDDAALRQQIHEKGLHDGFEDVIGLGGQDYRAVLKRAFATSDTALYFPFSGMRLGPSFSATKRAVATGQAFPD
jgi:hypothetical protein